MLKSNEAQSMLANSGLFQNKIRENSQASRSAFHWALFIFAMLVSDMLAIGLAFRVAYFIRFEAQIPLFKLEIEPSVLNYSNLVLLLIPVWLMLYAWMGLYNRRNILAGTKEYSLVFYGASIGMLVVIVAGFLGTDLVIARGWLLVSWFLSVSFTSLGRFALRRMLRLLRKRGILVSPAVIIGANEEGRLLAEQLLDPTTSGMQLVGFVDVGEYENLSKINGLPIIGTLSHLEALIQAHGLKEIIIASSAVSRDDLVRIFNQYGVADGTHIRLSSGLYEIITTGLDVREIASVPFVNINKVRLAGIDQWLKMLLDYGLTIPGMLVTAVFFGLIALAVRLDSPGPVIYRRKVMGLNGKTFDAFKFRTMYVNGDEILSRYPDLKGELERTHKLKNDPRITRVGKILRKLSLDELPQLLNVLRNEMSLVGPRMISPAELKNYSQWGMNLLTIRPGITGLWQVSGRSDVSYEQRVRLDMYYIRNWTVWLDIQILFRTIPAVLKSRGAY